jgi:hypothetical protein
VWTLYRDSLYELQDVLSKICVKLLFVVTIYREEVEEKDEPYHKDLYDILQSDFNGIMKNIIIQIVVAVSLTVELLTPKLK